MDNVYGYYFDVFMLYIATKKVWLALSGTGLVYIDMVLELFLMCHYTIILHNRIAW